MSISSFVKAGKLAMRLQVMLSQSSRAVTGETDNAVPTISALSAVFNTDFTHSLFSPSWEDASFGLFFTLYQQLLTC